jgi:cyclin B
LFAFKVQENFELNHETLYLAVKIVDTYFASVPQVPRDNVQLIGAVSLFLSSKFDVSHLFLALSIVQLLL